MPAPQSFIFFLAISYGKICHTCLAKLEKHDKEHYFTHLIKVFIMNWRKSTKYTSSEICVDFCPLFWLGLFFFCFFSILYFYYWYFNALI